ncbi:MAG: hypothetical protein FWC93_05440 [Defluviitaleaceae bacterium]|nr:hypothetical protein [Defluviitaleaceae bacterium]
MSENNNENKDNKWDFSDYAYTITGILVGVLLVVPEILYSQFGISILGGSLGDIAPELAEGIEGGQGFNMLGINELRALSPLLFLLTTTICMFKDAIDARKSGGYKGSMFIHTFESLFEEAIYMAITTIMVYGAVMFGAMYASWLAGPITWVLFVFIFPLVKKKSGDADETNMPWSLLFIFTAGIIAEIITGIWLAFPLSWLIICAIKLVSTVHKADYSIDRIFDILYYAFSVILMAVGIGLDLWIASWSAFPIALFICWVISKLGRFKQATPDKDSGTS